MIRTAAPPSMLVAPEAEVIYMRSKDWGVTWHTLDDYNFLYPRKIKAGRGKGKKDKKWLRGSK
jgi:hypothetical protein